MQPIWLQVPQDGSGQKPELAKVESKNRDHRGKSKGWMLEEGLALPRGTTYQIPHEDRLLIVSEGRAADEAKLCGQRQQAAQTMDRGEGRIGSGIAQEDDSDAENVGHRSFSMASRVYRGSSTWGEQILTAESGRVHQGSSTWGDIIMAISGDAIYEGSGWGRTLATVDGDCVYAGGTRWGKIIAVVNGNWVHRGVSTWGPVIATIDGGGRMTGAAAAAYLLLL